MAKVTVLMAVCNAETYLHESIASVLAQTMADFQLICIDDGSTDSSLSVLQHFAEADNRISVFVMPQNEGQARARNEGLKMAAGQYVCMLDADDTFSPDALDSAVRVFEQYPDTDSVLFEVSKDWPDHSEPYPMPPFVSLSGEEAFRLSLTWQIHGLYMVRRSLHQQFPYDDTCRLYSDDNTTRLHYLNSRMVRRCQGVYHYRQHAASATHQVSVRRFDYLRANESMREQLLRLNQPTEVLSLYENHRWLNLVGICQFYHCYAKQLPPAERSYGLSELRHVWKTIDRTLLSPRLSRKFGYRPMSSWWLFRCEEWLYFTLRGLMGKNGC